MITQSSYQAFVESISPFGRALVYREIPYHQFSLLEVKQCLVNAKNIFSIFEMSSSVSVFAFNPQATLKVFGNKVLVIDSEGAKQLATEPLTALRQYYQHYRITTPHPLARYAGGAVRFYEL